jgi:hypothetical protein
MGKSLKGASHFESKSNISLVIVNHKNSPPQKTTGDKSSHPSFPGLFFLAPGAVKKIALGEEEFSVNRKDSPFEKRLL